MRDKLLLLLSLALLAPPAGCKKDDCATLEPQVEVSLRAGSGVPTSRLSSFEVRTRLSGGALKSYTVTRKEAAFSGAEGRFVIRFDQPSLKGGETLWLEVRALDNAGKLLARGQPADNPVS
jgi:hypothetical protein